jgi:hypothetical protein
VFRNRLARGIKNDLGMKNEMKIGEVMPFGFKKIKCILANKKDFCKGCCIRSVKNCLLLEKVVGACDESEREAGENVIFQIVEE